MRFVCKWGVVCLAIPLWCSVACAQQAAPAEDSETDTRAGQIEEQRKQKAAALSPDVPAKPDRVLQKIENDELVERITSGISGWRLKLGGLITGSGFAVGPEYERQLLHEQVSFDASLSASLKEYYLMQARVGIPQFARGRMFVEFGAEHRDYPQIDYYGPGPNSEKTGRTNFRLEDTMLDGRIGVRLLPRLRLGVVAGYQWVNVGPGTSQHYASADRVYGPIQAPGIDRQTNFLRAGAFIQFDNRDNPGGPRRGGNYIVQYTSYSDTLLHRFAFSRVDAEAQHYIPFTNRRRVIALRAKTSFTDAHHGNQVPFYLQPRLGGSEELRGYRFFRFTDNNALVMNAEYRWEVFSGLDMALFADAGKVFPKWQQISLHDLESSAGFGFRFNVRNSVFFRIDVGFSHEGFQIWFKFSNVF